MQLDLFENTELQEEKESESTLIGYRAALLELDDRGNEIERTGFNWIEKFKTKKEVETWEASLRTRRLISDFEFIEPIPVFVRT